MGKKSFTFILVGFLLLSFGCRPSGLTGLVACKGRVTLDGNPLEGSVVTLIPNRTEGGGNGPQRNAVATTDSGGRFVMTTLKENDGVFPGKYWIIVTKYEPSGKIIKLDQVDPETGENILFEESINRLPAKYENYRQSNLEIDVPAGGVKDLVLELISKT